MKRHLLAVLALAIVAGLGLLVGGCSSGCGHCEDPGYAEAVCDDGCGECAPPACEPCGRSLDTWYQCPHCGTTSAYDGRCVHHGTPLEVRHAGTQVSPVGGIGAVSGNQGGGWQAELSKAEASVQGQVAASSKACNCPECAKKFAAAKRQGCAECAKKSAAAKHQGCAECAKKSAAAKHQGCAECAKKGAQPQRRSVVREKPAPKPIAARSADVRAAG